MEKSKNHFYQLDLEWKGNRGEGTSHYQAYGRDFNLSSALKKTVLLGSSDPNFRGDPQRYNPEEMLLGALASCHMLWYLHLCAQAGIIITAYKDHPVGTMTEEETGGGQFTKVMLSPKVTIKEKKNIEQAKILHQKAQEMCFIARSVRFKIMHQPEINIQKEG